MESHLLQHLEASTLYLLGALRHELIKELVNVRKCVVYQYQSLPQAGISHAGTCVNHRNRHSMALVLESWDGGSFPDLDA